MQDCRDIMVPTTVDEAHGDALGDSMGGIYDISSPGPKDEVALSPAGNLDDSVMRMMEDADLQELLNSALSDSSPSYNPELRQQLSSLTSLMNTNDIGASASAAYGHVSAADSSDELVDMVTSDEDEDEENKQEGTTIDEIMAMPAKLLNDSQKKIRRRELNRRAAQRSRGKKKATAETLDKDVIRLTQKNKELRSQLAVLEKEKEKMMAGIKEHFKGCRQPNFTHPSAFHYNFYPHSHVA